MSKMKDYMDENSSEKDEIISKKHEMTSRSTTLSTTATNSTPFVLRSAKKRNLIENEQSGAEVEVEVSKTKKKLLEDAIPIESVIVGRSFRIYQVSQLFGLVYERRFLKSLSRKLNFCMQKENRFGYDYVSFGGNSMLQIDITPLCGANEDIVGILIKVVNTGEYDDLSKEIFFGVMTSGGCSEAKNVRQGFVWLPLLLVKGSIEITDRITNFFTREFDCVINAYNLPSAELCWLAAIWAGFNNAIIRRALILTYETPDNVTELSKLTLTIDSEDIYDLWTHAHDVESSKFSIEEMTAFIRGLEQHIYRYFTIDLRGLRLIQVQNMSIMANCRGKLKLFTHSTAVRIINHIISLVVR